MALVSKGQTGPAIDLLESLVKDSPNDWRARGRLAELYLKTDNPGQAEAHLRQVGMQMMADGQYKPALAVYKQLAKLCPKDGEIAGRLGECQHQSRFLNDAKKCYTDAIALLATQRPRQAAYYAQKLLELAPDETSVRVRFAELLDAAGESARAAVEWGKLAAQAEARGRPNDRARFLEKVLQGAPTDFAALVGAAESRIAMGDAKAAFPHLQRAHTLSKDPLRVLELLARAFEGVGQATKARQVWLECAKAAAKTNTVAVQKKALEAALRIQPDERLQDELAALGGARVERDLALSKEAWAAPATDAEARTITRAEVETRYGFPERAIRTLERGPKSVSVSVALAERRMAVHQNEGALAALEDLAVEGPEARRLVELQREQLERRRHDQVEAEPTDDPMSLEGDLEPLEDELASAELSPLEEVVDPPTLDPPALEELEPLPDEEPLDEEQALSQEEQQALSEDPAAESADETEADLLAGEGRSSEAMALYRKALVGDPANERVLMKIGELLSGDPPQGEQRTTRMAIEPAPETRASEKAPEKVLAKAPERVPTKPPERMPTKPPEQVPTKAPERMSTKAPAVRAATPRAEAPVEIPLDEDAAPASQLADMSDDELRVLQARAWMAVFQYRDAIEAVHGVSGLAALVVRSDAKRFVSQSGEACASLQLALAEAAEDDPAYREALWVLSGLYVAMGKAKTAKRLLLELEELDPRYRAEDVANRLRGLGMLERLK
jgi:tetratricopeptide (TPR) repeat protein